VILQDLGDYQVSAEHMQLVCLIKQNLINGKGEVAIRQVVLSYLHRALALKTPSDVSHPGTALHRLTITPICQAAPELSEQRFLIALLIRVVDQQLTRDPMLEFIKTERIEAAS
jgi:hypothetical protein